MKNILIVDDNEQNLYLVEVLLKSHNYKTMAAKNGKEALEIAKKNDLELIISDILMPVMDGFSLCRIWKNDVQLKNIPFVFYTATYTDQKDEEYALSIGADRFFRKPMEPDAFLKKIISVVDAARQKQIIVREPLVKEEDEGYKLYSSRLVKKLEKKMLDLEQEIQQREIIENDLKKARQEWKNIFQAVGNPTFIIDPEYTILKANQATVNITNFSDEELIGKKCYEIFHNATRPHPNCPMCRLLQNEKIQATESEIEALGWTFLIACTPVFNDDHSLQKVIHVATDITDLKKTEQSLRDSEEKFRGVFENAHIGIALANKEGELEGFNEEFRALLGYDSIELKGMKFSEFTYPDDLQSKMFYFNEILKGKREKYRTQNRYITKSGEIIWIELTVSVVRSSSGNIKQFIGMVLNINDQKKSEEKQQKLENQLKQAQKMESIGNLAGGIAHDFNNILTPIIGFSEMLLDDLPSGSHEREDAQNILDAGKRGSALVQQILAFSRQSELRKTPVRVQQVLKEVLKLSRSIIPSDIEIKQDIQTDCGLVIADATQLHQIAMNLIINAYHAVEKDSGNISVTFKETILGKDNLNNMLLKPGKYAVLSVSDNGTGISKNNLSKIFEPYFTTKEIGKGTGLGLATVFGIVKDHGGEIQVDSEKEAGSTFRVYLPLMEKKPENTPDYNEHFLQHGTERILIVDDEISVTKLVKRFLEPLGYIVTALNSSIDALEKFCSTPNSFDLIITDMTMPNMTGDKLAKEILLIRSDIPIIICTGFSKKISKQQAEVIGVSGFLMKPVMKLEMAQMVRKLLDEAKKSD